jgi:hypothetical protein
MHQGSQAVARAAEMDDSAVEDKGVDGMVAGRVLGVAVRRRLVREQPR